MTIPLFYESQLGTQIGILLVVSGTTLVKTTSLFPVSVKVILIHCYSPLLIFILSVTYSVLRGLFVSVILHIPLSLSFQIKFLDRVH